MGEVKDWIQYFNSEVEKMELLEAEYHIMLLARGAGKSNHMLERAKKHIEKGGELVLSTKNGFIPLNGELRMAELTANEILAKEMAKHVDKYIEGEIENGRMHISLDKVAEDVHNNAVAHGWWEAKRSKREVDALIHSEWSEALEEARAGRPMVWHGCMDAGQEKQPVICEACVDCVCKKDMPEHDCEAYNEKPEGIAVELIDGVIRILDYLGKENELVLDDWELTPKGEEILCREFPEHKFDLSKVPVAELVDMLHEFVVQDCWDDVHTGYHYAIATVFAWVKAQGISPEVILVHKHQYNKTRPYKHGKKF